MPNDMHRYRNGHFRSERGLIFHFPHSLPDSAVHRGQPFKNRGIPACLFFQHPVETTEGVRLTIELCASAKQEDCHLCRYEVFECLLHPFPFRLKSTLAFSSQNQRIALLDSSLRFSIAGDFVFQKPNIDPRGQMPSARGAVPCDLQANKYLAT